MPLAGQFLRYALVGAANTAAHLGLLLLLVEVAGCTPLAGNALAFVGASALSFQLNARYTFGRSMQWRRYLRFLAVALLGLAIHSGTLWCAQIAGWHYLVGVTLGIGVAVLVGFALNRSLVFGG